MASMRAVPTAALWALLAGAANAAAIDKAPDTAVVELDIAPQPVGDALSRLAEAAGVQIVFYSDVAAGVIAPRLEGSFTIRQALDRLLAGTSLEYEFLNEHTISVRARPATDDDARPQSNRAAETRSTSAATDRREGASRRAARESLRARDPLKLDEVMVTARRRFESLQATPVALTALSAEALELRQVHTADALAQFVPNLQFDGAAPLSGAAYNATIFIRGVGQNDFAIFSDPGVAVYLDGVYLGRSIGGVMDLLDLEQVEVLRGPQGTLFGRNTIGGAIILRSREPEAELGGELALTAGSLDRRDARGVLNLPISETASTRIAAASVHRDGYATRLTDHERLGDKGAAIGRAQLAWHPSDRFAGTLTLDATRVEQNSAALTLIDVAPDGAPLLTLYNALIAPTAGITAPSGGSALDASWITGDIDTTYAGGRTINSLRSVGAALTLESQTDAVQIKSITAWRKLDAVFARDGDNTPFTFRETFNDDRQKQFSQELQGSGATADARLTWVGGLYLFGEDAREDGRALLAPGLYDALSALELAPGYAWCALSGPNPRPIDECPPALRFGGEAYRDNNLLVDLDVDLHTRVSNRSVALFAQGSYRIAERWGITAGLRWTVDRKEVELEHRRRASDVYVVGAPNTQRRFDASWSQLTPKLGIEWNVSDDAMLYASYARGFKSGGFNGRPLVDSSEVRTPYDPEVVDSYELGAKTRWFDGRATANAAFFYNEYRDMQLSINATPQNFVRNAGAARISGAELEVVARLAPGLDANLQTGFLNAEYTRLDPQLAMLSPPLTRDKELIKAPEWTLSAGLQYRWRVQAGFVTLRGDYIYKERTYHDVFNDPRLVQPSYEIVNAVAAFTTANERWELSLLGTNLTDERYRVSANSSVGLGLAESTFAAPRELALRLRYRY